MKKLEKYFWIIPLVIIVGAAIQREFFKGESTYFSRSMAYLVEPIDRGSKAIESIFKKKKLKGTVTKTEFRNGNVYLYLGLNPDSDFIVANPEFFQDPLTRLKDFSSESIILAMLRTGEETIGFDVVAKGEVKPTPIGANYVVIDDQNNLRFSK